MESPRVNQKSPLLLNPEQAIKVLSIFIERELHRTGLKKAVIGLSGGVDSALSTYLTARAIGAENLHVVMMPYKTSSADSLAHARLIVDDLKLSHEVVEITPMADALFSASPEIDKLRRGNIMARMRMITLYDRSQLLNGLVIGTSNKTESLLGYTTLFGDNASAINPLGDLYKTQVWQLSEYIGMPKEIVAKPPSADLWEGQTDEAEMGLTYREVDELLFHMIDVRESDEQLVNHGFDLEFIRKIRQKIVRTQFKRRPPVIAKLSNRTINVDFR
ncbi:MAG TPA: NAD+ synthase, partial [Candidatus Kapabacteria bacterium]|nr:NAD+ synthase [Candidatus Kapabacteria bacterium]